MEEADLVSYGLGGLMSAIDRFDLSREIKFETYAIMRIKGAIIDELRSLDWVPRSVRARAREVEKAISKLEHNLHRQPTDEEIAQEMGITVDELNDSLLAISHSSIVALDELWSVSDSSGDQVSLMDTIEDPGAPDPARALDLGDLKDRIADSIAKLPEREKLVIALYYYENLTLREIGEVLGVTESRVSQMHTKAVLRLRSQDAGGSLRRLGRPGRRSSPWTTRQPRWQPGARGAIVGSQRRGGVQMAGNVALGNGGRPAADRIRNVALVGHRGSGKTSLHEALLYESGATNRLGIRARAHDRLGLRSRRAGPPDVDLRDAQLDRVAGPQDQPHRHPGRARASVYIQNAVTGVTVPVPIPPVTPFNPPLGRDRPGAAAGQAADRHRLSGLRREALMLGHGRVGPHRRRGDRDGTLDVVRYGQILRARSLVGVRGAGLAFDGLHYVDSVTHNLKPGEYKQSFVAQAQRARSPTCRWCRHLPY